MSEKLGFHLIVFKNFNIKIFELTYQITHRGMFFDAPSKKILKNQRIDIDKIPQLELGEYMNDIVLDGIFNMAYYTSNENNLDEFIKHAKDAISSRTWEK